MRSPAHPPSNTVAAVLSLLIPGAGQMYKGRISLGLLWLVLTLFAYITLCCRASCSTSSASFKQRAWSRAHGGIAHRSRFRGAFVRFSNRNSPLLPPTAKSRSPSPSRSPTGICMPPPARDP
jgi:hypothetical protein